MLNLPYYHELKSHKLRRTIPAPNSYFFNLRCIQCREVKRCFSHGHSKIECIKCNRALATPTGGKLRINIEFAVAENVNNVNKKIQKREPKGENKGEKKEEKKDEAKNSKRN